MLIEEWIKKKRLLIVDEVTDWIEAIEIVGQPLVDQKHISVNYLKKIIECVEKEGPYIVIAPYIALPHVRYPEGVYSSSTSLLKLNKPFFVKGDNETPIQLVICLAAKNDNDHIETIKEIGELFGNEKLVDEMLLAKTITDFEIIDIEFRSKGR